MIELTMKLPNRLYVACSGGIDSMVAYRFIERSGRDVTPVYVDHGDDVAEDEMRFLRSEFGNRLLVLTAARTQAVGTSKEYEWSKQRHALLTALVEPVVLGHNLDDCVETWVTSTLQGKPTLMASRNRNMIRPFLLTAKEEFYKYARNNGIRWIEDPTNADTSYAQRNYVRHELLPRAYVVNPGLRKTVRKMLRKREADMGNAHAL